MADDIAIKVEQVSKDFVLPHEKVTSVKSAFTSMFNRNRTKEAQHALKGISFEIREGEFFGIVGRNGSGKSTMLKILAGIYQPTKGKVSVKGKLVPFIELGVGFNPELTGRENVFLNGAMLGFSRKEIDAMYDDIVAFAELERFMDQKLKNYSSGMQVRLAFSMATRSQADILLIDEVLAVGDADFQRKCFDYFKTLKRDKKTVIFVSHDMDAVREYCDGAMLIDKSELVQIGTTNAVAGAYSQLFTGSGVVKKGELGGARTGTQVLSTTKLDIRVTEKEVVLTQVVHAKEDLQNAIFGIRIRDAASRDVTGTNTKIESVASGLCVAGTDTRLEWRLPNIFGDGTYSVDPAILYEDGITISDWWNDGVTFTVKKKRHVPYTVVPEFDITVSHKVKG